MFLQQRHFLAAILVGSLAASSALADATPAQDQLAKQLGWVTEPNQYNLCGGYYKELPIPYVPNTKVSSQTNNYNIYANYTDYSFIGNSTLHGNVRVIRPNSEMTADTAHLIRDPVTKKIVTITADGNARYLSQGMLMIGDHANLETTTDKISVNNLIYRHSQSEGTVAVKNPSTGQTENHLYQSTARGTAKFAEQVKRHIFSFKHASYTTCPPKSNVWKLTGTRIGLNYVSGWGQLVNGFLFIKGIPVMYLPFYGFPIDKRRHTGFLAPSYGSSSTDGYTLSLPFYWNMAPNYDMLITPDWMSYRGIKTNLAFRYLTDLSTGNFGFSFLPHDRAFGKFQQNAPANFSESGQSEQLRKLEDESDNRKAFTWDNSTAFNDRWSDDVALNYASDNYYTQDFGNQFFASSNSIDGNNNNLLEKIKLNYQSTYFHSRATVQGYQTFHPINASPIANQYTKLPQLGFGANSPLIWGGLATNFSSQYTYFDIAANPNQIRRPVFGSRLFAEPGLSYNLEKPYGFLTPRIKLHAIGYQLHNNLAKTPSQAGRIIPIFSTHGQLIFVREIHPFNYGLKQTLEPEFYYLYTPFVPQNTLPNFDTDQAAFSYDSMFSYNRFSGEDRVGDANQISLGLTTRLIDLDSGDQKALASIGEVYYFRNRKVSACYGRSDKCKNAATSAVNREKISPIAAKLQYNFNADWNLTGNWAWNPILRKTANEYLAFQYNRDNNHIINLGYSDINNDVSGIGITKNHLSLDSTLPTYQELRQATLSTSWALSRHIQLLGSLDHDWATSQGKNHALSYNTYDSFFYGAQYNSCCWAVRLLGYRQYNGLNDKNRATFQHGIFLQIALIGLGTLGHSIGSSNSASMLNNITGYRDTFGQGAIK
jgi:LPS-assembly protein